MFSVLATGILLRLRLAAPIRASQNFFLLALLEEKKPWRCPTFPPMVVSSALEGLTSEFGMGSGVTPPPLSPGKPKYTPGLGKCPARVIDIKPINLIPIDEHSL